MIMTTQEKVNALLTLALEVAPTLPAGDDLKHRAIHLACSLYRNRYGVKPSQRIIDLARFGEKYEVIHVTQDSKRWDSLIWG